MYSRFKQIVFLFAPPLLCLFYGVYLVWLIMSNKILFFIHSSMVPFSWFGMFVLLLLGVINLIYAGRDLAANTSPHTAPRHFWLALLPIFVMIFLPLRPLSTSFASLKTTILEDARFSRDVNDAPKFVLNTENRPFLDWVQLFAQNPEPEQYEGMKAKLSGFVLPDKRLPPNAFFLARFVLSCCVADATPVTIQVRYNPAHVSLKPDQWIEVSGHFKVEEYEGERKPVLYAESVRDIPIPENPYLN